MKLFKLILAISFALSVPLSALALQVPDATNALKGTGATTCEIQNKQAIVSNRGLIPNLSGSGQKAKLATGQPQG